MSNPLRDAVAKAGAKVARCKLNLAMAERELEAAQKVAMDTLTDTSKKVEYKHSIFLTGFGQNKIAVIKAVRMLTTLGLKEAKELTDMVNEHNPPVVLDHVSEGEVKNAKKVLEEAGGRVKLTKHRFYM